MGVNIKALLRKKATSRADTSDRLGLLYIAATKICYELTVSNLPHAVFPIIDRTVKSILFGFFVGSNFPTKWRTNG